MKNHIVFNRLIMGFILLFVIISATAQEIDEQKNWILDIGLSGVTQNASKEMYKHMDLNGFDDDEWWIFWSGHGHPHYTNLSSSIHSSLSRHIGKNFYVGVLYSRSQFRGVQGYYDFPGFNSSAEVTVNLSNNTVGPILTYVLMDRLEFQMGPVVMINKSTRDSYEEHIEKNTHEQYVQTVPGGMAGINVRINRYGFHVKFFIQGLYTPINHKVAAFYANKGPELPSKVVDFSHLKIGLSFSGLMDFTNK